MADVQSTFEVRGKADVQEYLKGMDQARVSTQGLKNIAGALATTLVASLSAAFVAAGREAVLYEDTMTRLGFAVEAAGIQFDGARGRVDSFLATTARGSMFAQRSVAEAMTAIANQTAALGPTLSEMERMTRLAVDLADQTGMSLTQAASTVSSAFAGNVRAVGSAIPGLRDAAREIGAIENAAVRGEAALGLLEGQFQGASSGAMNTHHEIGMVTARMQDLLGAVGQTIIESDQFQSALTALVTQLNQFLEALEGGNPEMQALVENVKVLADAVGIGLKVAIGAVNVVMGTWNLAVGMTETLLTAMFGAIEVGIGNLVRFGRAVYAIATGDMASLRNIVSETQGAFEHYANSVTDAMMDTVRSVIPAASAVGELTTSMGELATVTEGGGQLSWWDTYARTIRAARVELEALRAQQQLLADKTKRDAEQRRPQPRRAGRAQVDDVIADPDKLLEDAKRRVREATEEQSRILEELASKAFELEVERRRMADETAARRIAAEQSVLDKAKAAAEEQTALMLRQAEQQRAYWVNVGQGFTEAFADAAGQAIATGENLGQALTRAGLRSVGQLAANIGRMFSLAALGASASPIFGFSGPGLFAAGAGLQILGASLGAVAGGGRGGGGGGQGRSRTPSTGVQTMAAPGQGAPQVLQVSDFRGATVVTNDPSSMRALLDRQDRTRSLGMGGAL
jgi:hypothetical protein